MNKRKTRREFVRDLAVGAGAVAISPYLLSGCRSVATAGAGSAATGWGLVPGILNRIVPPRFADRDFEITKFGAVGDGVTDCTQSFRSAISECAKAGGGRVVA